VVEVLLANNAKLSPAQQVQGWEILCNYWERYSTPSPEAALWPWKEVARLLEVENVEFVLTGDTTDWTGLMTGWS